MDIRNIAYKLYKAEWEEEHVPSGTKLDVIREWGNEEEECSFEDFLEEHGYHGALHACEAEFLQNEYKDKKHMLSLLKNKELCRQYLNDIKEDM